MNLKRVWLGISKFLLLTNEKTGNKIYHSLLQVFGHNKYYKAIRLSEFCCLNDAKCLYSPG